MLKSPLAAAKNEGPLVARYLTGTAGMQDALRGADARRDCARPLFEIGAQHSPFSAYRTAADAERAAGIDLAFSRGAFTGSSLVWEQRLVTDRNGQLIDTMQPNPRAHNLTQRAVDDFFADSSSGYRATYDALGTVTQKTMALVNISEKISAQPQLLGTFAGMISDFLDEIGYRTIPQEDLDSFLRDIGKNICWSFDTIELRDGEKLYVASRYENEMAVATVGRLGVPLTYVSDGHDYRVMQRSGFEVADEPQEFTFKILRFDGSLENIRPGSKERIFTRNEVSFSVLPDGRAIELPRDTSSLTAVSAMTGQKCFMHESADGVFYAVTFDKQGKPCELSDRETHIVQNGTVWQKYTDGSFRMAATNGTLVTSRELIQVQEGRVTKRITQANARVRILAYRDTHPYAAVVFTADAFFSDDKNKILAYKDPTSGNWKSMNFRGYHSVSLGALEFTDGREVPANGFFRYDETSKTWAFVEYKVV